MKFFIKNILLLIGIDFLFSSVYCQNSVAIGKWCFRQDDTLRSYYQLNPDSTYLYYTNSSEKLPALADSGKWEYVHHKIFFYSNADPVLAPDSTNTNILFRKQRANEFHRLKKFKNQQTGFERKFKMEMSVCILKQGSLCFHFKKKFIDQYFKE